MATKEAAEKAGRDRRARSGASRLLAVDVGNSFTSLGLFCGEELAARWTVTTRGRTTADEARVVLADLLRLPVRGEAAASAGAAALHGIDDAVLSCVVPDLTEAWRTALASACGRRPLVVGPGLKTGLKMRYNDPAEIGPDRIADLVAAKAAYSCPVVVVDLGTTTNFEVLDADGAFVGGILAPGLELSARAASQAAARLPVVELRAPRSVLGKNTREAMQSGMVYGEVARVDGLIDMIWDELGCETQVVATGEGAEYLTALSRRIQRTDGTLTLRGLRLIHERNRAR